MKCERLSFVSLDIWLKHIAIHITPFIFWLPVSRVLFVFFHSPDTTRNVNSKMAVSVDPFHGSDGICIRARRKKKTDDELRDSINRHNNNSN